VLRGDAVGKKSETRPKIMLEKVLRREWTGVEKKQET